MQSAILKMNIALCGLIVAILVSSCKSKSNLENQISIIINSVDKETGEKRVNMFDTVVVRVARPGILMRQYVDVAEYITDSTGSVRVKLDKDEEYRFRIFGKKGLFGAIDFLKGGLRDGQVVNIKVISLENW